MGAWTDACDGTSTAAETRSVGEEGDREAASEGGAVDEVEWNTEGARSSCRESVSGCMYVRCSADPMSNVWGRQARGREARESARRRRRLDAAESSASSGGSSTS